MGAVKAFLGLQILLLFALQVSGWNGTIALVSSLSIPAKNNTLKWPKCQWANQKRYCDMHKYRCFFIVDSHLRLASNESVPVHFNEWQRVYARDKFGIGPHWFKIYVLLLLLPKFDVVVLLDTDCIWQNHRLSLNGVLDASGSRWWIMPFLKGITTNILIIKNTPDSQAAMQHLWSLREVCPACPKGEQCAVNVLLHEFLADWILRRGTTLLRVANDGNKTCCNPRAYCAFPSGSLRRANRKAGWSVQGCTWQWWFATDRELMRRTHLHIHWQPGHLQFPLNIWHPVKTLKLCKALDRLYNHSKKSNIPVLSFAGLKEIVKTMPDRLEKEKKDPVAPKPLQFAITSEVLDKAALAARKSKKILPKRLCIIRRGEGMTDPMPNIE